MIAARKRVFGITRTVCALTLATLLTLPAGAAPAVTDRMVDTGGGKLHFRVIPGCAPTIVLESGGGLDASQWAQLQPLLSAATGAAVVSYDRAGFGESDLPQGAFGLEQQVAWLHQGLAQLHVPNHVILVGHSYGAFLTQIYARNYPKSVDAVVLIDPNTVAFIDAVGGPQNIPINISDDMPPKVKRATENQRDSAQQDVLAARNAPLAASIPVTVIAADKRWLPSEEWNDKFAAGRKSLVESYPDRKLIVAGGSGHMVTVDRPDVVLAAVVDAVKKARSTDRSAGRCESAGRP